MSRYKAQRKLNKLKTSQKTEQIKELIYESKKISQNFYEKDC